MTYRTRIASIPFIDGITRPVYINPDGSGYLDKNGHIKRHLKDK
jgi:hypothetical protein